MQGNHILFDIFLIFSGAAVLSTLVLYTRQSLLVAYILIGVLLGPWGLKLLPDAGLAKEIGDVGIIFLLFLLGLELNPLELWHMLRKVSWIAFVSSLIFFAFGVLVGFSFGFRQEECFVIGSAMMFSSTIIGLKLLPSTTLHHQRIGEVMVSILLLQDLIAITVMLFLHGMSTPSPFWQDIGITLITLPSLLLIGFVFERYLLRYLLSRFENVQEYVFLVAIAWCLGMAELGTLFGLSDGIGAFIAGVAIAEGPVARYMSDNLKPLRDFCLVMFFFTIGARFNIQALSEVWLPATILAALMLIVKPILFKFLLKKSGESELVAHEAGVRLGQGSEFSLLLGAMATQIIPWLVSAKTNYLIQTTTMLTFIISCYWVVLRYPTPMALSKKLQRD
jgi:Kef-type K+ transport system membrane component KefB